VFVDVAAADVIVVVVVVVEYFRPLCRTKSVQRMATSKGRKVWHDCSWCCAMLALLLFNDFRPLNH